MHDDDDDGWFVQCPGHHHHHHETRIWRYIVVSYTYNHYVDTMDFLFFSYQENENAKKNLQVLWYVCICLCSYYLSQVTIFDHDRIGVVCLAAVVIFIIMSCSILDDTSLLYIYLSIFLYTWIFDGSTYKWFFKLLYISNDGYMYYVY